MNEILTEDTKAIILLCGVFGKDSSQKPLTLTEYSSLVNWLVSVKMRPSDLLKKENIAEVSKGARISINRMESLLNRGVQLGFAVEEWHRNGIWIISRSDSDYPTRFKKHLKDKSPPILFGSGDKSLLQSGGLAIVGSRNVDEVGEKFTRKVAELCASNEMPVISGGARGVDQISMNTALEAGGVTIGILAENLLKKSVEKKIRNSIADGNLCLISPYHPNARFTVGTAMGRNKLIYALADYGLVISAEFQKGGTWTGAQEELRRKNSRPIFVRIADKVPSGNTKLLELGAIAWPDSIKNDNVNEQLKDLSHQSNTEAFQKDLSLFDISTDEEIITTKKQQLLDEPSKDRSKAVEKKNIDSDSPSSIYQAVLPLILNELVNPRFSEELAKILEVNKIQLNAWLKKAVEEKQIVKLTRPVRYIKNN